MDIDILVQEAVLALFAALMLVTAVAYINERGKVSRLESAANAGFFGAFFAIVVRNSLELAKLVLA